MNRRKAWVLAKPFIDPDSIAYDKDELTCTMTGTNHDLYLYQCAANYIMPLEAKKTDNGWFFVVKYNDVREVQI